MGEPTTQQKLLEAGRREFLDKGFKDASLRAIVKRAGFTLGAFYGYYESKEALFEAIVGAAAESLYRTFAKGLETFQALPEEEQPKQLNTASASSLEEMIDLIYADFDTYKLLFFGAAGTRYEDNLQRLVDLEIDSTYQFIQTLGKQGFSPEVDEDIIHILASAMFSGMLEMVAHDMPKDKAVRYIEQLRDFYSAGWFHLLGL